jgi:DNA polymerase-4
VLDVYIYDGVRTAFGKFYGVGPATEAKMLKLGIKMGGSDLRTKSQLELVQHFGKSGDYYFNIA